MVDLYKITPLALCSDLKQDGIFIPFSDDYVIQQFTGLTDSTGKEIYEGDICHYKWDRHDHDIEESIGEVFFEDGIFLFGRKDLFCTSDSNFRIDSLEVIGNVFENPDL